MQERLMIYFGYGPVTYDVINESIINHYPW